MVPPTGGAEADAGSHIYILHELLADGSDLLGECRGEHHHLFLVGRHPEDLLNVTSHVCNNTGTRDSLVCLQPQHGWDIVLIQMCWSPIGPVSGPRYMARLELIGDCRQFR